MTNVLAALVSAFLVLWTLIPLYNMVLIALRGESDVFSDQIFPVDPTLGELSGRRNPKPLVS